MKRTLTSFPVLGCALIAARLLTFSTQGSIALQIGQNFSGTEAGVQSDASPADANGAVGPQHFVEFVNGRYSVYEKATAKRLQTKTDQQFWNAAGVTFTSTVGTTDPRTIFDFYSQRWFTAMVSFTINSPRQRSNRFLLAISETADPTGKWNGFSIPSDPNALNFADFPTLGVDATAVYLSGDMFDRSGIPVGASVVVVSKTELLSTSPTVSARTYLGPFPYSARGNILQPAVTTGTATTPETLLAVSDLGLDFQPLTTLVLSSVLNPTNNPTLSSPPVVLDVPSYSVPINPPQPDGTDSLDDGDARIGAAVRRVGNTLYTTHAVQVDNRAAVRWYRIDAVKLTLIEAGTISDPSLDLYYPSIAANEAGTVVIGCNGSSTETYVSSYAVVGEITNDKLVFGELTLLKAGTASYQNTDSTGTSRWGDYSATSVDPVDPNRFWTIQMIATDTSTWTTQITELLTGTRLQMSHAGTNLILTWPTSANSQLQASTTLGPSALWQTAPEPTASSNGVTTVVIPVSSTNAFFRLVTP
jgi:hypothetical protein